LPETLLNHTNTVYYGVGVGFVMKSQY